MSLRVLWFGEMPPHAKKKPPARSTLNIRIRAETRSLIDRAARLRGTNRTDFILEAAARAAEETLLDRALISVGPAAFADFVARLDAPAKPSEQLQRTMRAPLPWETE
jgi:uncharacterized protein (DUF1778 family)